MVLITVVGLTVLLLGIGLCLAILQPNPTGNAADMFKIVSNGFSLCLGAILGLLGGKAF
jgi:hypothetical protein